MFAGRWLLAWLCLAAAAQAEILTLPRGQRPEWLSRDGIVMAGSWEPLAFRVRRDGGADYTPSAERRAAYVREHSLDMIRRLKALGANFAMIHCYKGGGARAERESMAEAAAFSKLCRENGLRVGVYVTSGTMMWDLLFNEVPQAKDWVIRDEQGQPRTYGKAAYRYYWNRNHPDAAAYHSQFVKFAIEEIKTDLIHFDNVHVGPGNDPVSIGRFRDYLRRTFEPDELQQAGAPPLDSLGMPTAASPALLRFAWADFSCQSLADWYFEMTRYARGLRPDILMECNPGGPSTRIRVPVDHGRLLAGGEAVWDEGHAAGFVKGRPQTRIRTYKIGRLQDNTTFCYTLTPLEMAESMAFNRDSLGAVCWFEDDQLTAKPGVKEPVSDALQPSIRFFHRRRDLLRDAAVIADVAALRTFPSQVFADAKAAGETYLAEQALIEGRLPFQILYDQQLDRLPRYAALVLAGCVALGDRETGLIRRYVEAGGTVIAVGPLATHDRWLRPRPAPALDDLPPARLIRLKKTDELQAAVQKVLGERCSLQVEAGVGLCAELTEQPSRRLAHLVNYRTEEPQRDVRVRLRLPAGRRAVSVALASPEHAQERKLAFEQQGAVATFTVPEVRVYEIAVVRWE